MQKLSLHLWFDHQAEEAAKFYTSVFKHSKILGTAYYTPAAEEVSGKKAGTVMTVEFELNGQKFVALNGGPGLKFNESMSVMIECESQPEIDHYWEKLVAGGGQHTECGWLKDRFGVSWQVTPAVLGRMIQDRDRERVDRVTAVMLKMKKLDIAKLKEAYEK